MQDKGRRDGQKDGVLGLYSQSFFEQLRDGKINATGSVTLTASAASTAVTDARVGGNSMVLFMPSTANAAAEQGAGTMYVSSVGKQTFTITHANNGQTDRTFSYAVFG